MPQAFSVFVSHKNEDSATAERIRVALEELFGSSITCFLSERIMHGQDWLGELHRQLRQSKYLLLIYTDPREDWSWCMYESGYFSALKSSSQDHFIESGAQRLIFCLHHEDLSPPGPLAHLQATKATHDRIGSFIDTMLTNNEIKVAPGQKERAVSAIAECFSDRDAVRFASESLTLIVKQKDRIDPLADLANALPEGSYFQGSEESLRSIFQRSDDNNRLNWKAAVETSRRVARINDLPEQFDVKWLTELVDVIYNASQHFNPHRPIRGLVFTGENNVIYCPVIREIGEHRTGVLSCEMVFLKWEGNQYPKAPDHIRQLMMATRVSIRFRQEFLDEFKDLAETARSEGRRGRADSFRSKVWKAFYEVLTEGTIRGLTGASLNGAFGAVGRQHLREISNRFAEAHVKFADAIGGNVQMSTSLVRPKGETFSEEELQDLEEAYCVFDEGNAKFLAMATVALDSYFRSLIPAQKWDAIKHEVANVAELSR